MRELRQQHEMHNLEKKMAAAYRETSADTPQEHARKLKADNRGILVFLALMFVGFGLFVWLS